MNGKINIISLMLTRICTRHGILNSTQNQEYTREEILYGHPHHNFSDLRSDRRVSPSHCTALSWIGVRERDYSDSSFFRARA